MNEAVANHVEAGAAPRAARFKPLFFVAGVFLFGAIAGGAAARAYTVKEQHTPWGGSSEERTKNRVETMTRQLDLDDKQAKSVEDIYKDTEGDREKAIEPCRPGLDDLRSRTDTKIRDVLDPSQRAKFDEFRQKRSKKP